MAPRTPFGSKSFAQVARGLVAIHGLIRAGTDESPEAESIRDSLDAPYKVLTPTERYRAQWLSEDLYSISNSPDGGTPQEPSLQAQLQLVEAIEARRNSEWDQALLLLRQAQKSTAPALVSYLRGSIWQESGHPHVATEFFRHASKCDPENVTCRAMYLHALNESDPEAAGKLAQQILDDDGAFAPALVARAAHVRFNATRLAPDASAQVYRDLIPVLERNMLRVEADVNMPSRATTRTMTLWLLGFCHENLGNAGAAIQYHTLGLQLNPRNDTLLVSRGILQYGSSPRAITDLQEAVRLGSPVVWPYLFLAHHYVTTGRFEECRLTCEAGLRTTASDTANSQLEEWKAIAQGELDFPPDLVLAGFEAAVRFDPSNEYAARNRDIFTASLRMSRAGRHSAWSQKSATAVRQFGIAERRGELLAA